MPQNLQKGFKNRVVTTFNAKLTLFGDHFSVMFPVLYQPCTTNLEPPEPLMASYVRFMAFWGCFWPFWGSLMAIWDLHAKLGLFWDQIWTLVPFGTKSQIWDFIGAPASDCHLWENIHVLVILILELLLHPLIIVFLSTLSFSRSLCLPGGIVVWFSTWWTSSKLSSFHSILLYAQDATWHNAGQESYREVW